MCGLDLLVFPNRFIVGWRPPDFRARKAARLTLGPGPGYRGQRVRRSGQEGLCARRPTRAAVVLRASAVAANWHTLGVLASTGRCCPWENQLGPFLWLAAPPQGLPRGWICQRRPKAQLQGSRVIPEAECSQLRTQSFDADSLALPFETISKTGP